MSRTDHDGNPPWRAQGERLKRARERARLTQKEVAEAIGVTEQSVSQWELGKTRPSLDKIPALARLFNLSESELLNAETVDYALPSHGRKLQVINRIQSNWEEVAESPGDSEDRFVIIEEAHAVSERAFALEITGSTNQPEFRPGDIVIMDPAVEPLPGDMVAARLEGSAQSVFRRYRPKGRDNAGNPVFDLVPINPDWPTLHVDAANPGEILGTMVEHRRYRAPNRGGFRGA